MKHSKNKKLRKTVNKHLRRRLIFEVTDEIPEKVKADKIIKELDPKTGKELTAKYIRTDEFL